MNSTRKHNNSSSKRSSNQARSEKKILVLKEKCNENIEYILEQLRVDAHDRGAYLNGPCPVHGGDNPTGFSWLKEEGLWACWTKGCHNDHGSDIIGLVSAIMDIGFRQSVRYLENMFTINYNDEAFERVSNKNFVRRVGTGTCKKTIDESMLAALSFDENSLEYLVKDRGFALETLRHFGVGLCKNPKARMKNRLVFPVRDKDGDLIGATGRSLDKDPYIKWKHFNAVNEHLFNYHKAKKHITESGFVIITEGPLGVLKLWECGIKNAVAIFGVDICKEQMNLLLESGAFSIVLALDADEAGSNATLKMTKNKLLKHFRVITLDIGNNKDIDEMPKEKVVELINEQTKTCNMF